MKKFKKMVAGLLTAAMSLSLTAVLPMSSASAAGTNILLGDVNGDNQITGADSMCIQAYLSGMLTVTPEELTAMDINQDGVIDDSDIWYIMIRLGNPAASMWHDDKFAKEVYSLPYNDTVTYRKHSCTSASSSSYTKYTLAQPEETPAYYRTSTYDEIATFAIDAPDKENTACVELEITDYNGNVTQGSGFIIGDNVIATSASCLYGTNGFVKNITATVHCYYDEKGNSFELPEIYKASAKTIHIPDSYITSKGSDAYDYGLIYFDKFTGLEDGDTLITSKYKAKVGVMTNKFLSDSNNILTTVGFTKVDNVWGRYKSRGHLTPIPSQLYRFHSSASAKGAKVGGMTYFTSYYEYMENNLPSQEAVNSAVGIATSGDANNTYGVAFDPSVLRFYLNNPNLS